MDIVGIRTHTGDQAWDGEIVDLPVGKIGDLPEQIVAQAAGGVPRHPGGHAVGDHIACDGQKGAEQHHKAPPHHQPHILQRRHIVNDMGQDIGQQQIHDGAGELHQQAQAHALEIGPHIADDQLHCVLSSPWSWL